MKKLYFLLLFIFVAFSAKSQVVISQVYGGGGNTGAPYTHDFVELFNRGTVAQDLTGWSIQYASTSGTTWSVNALPTFNLQPGQYFLIQLASGANGVALPTPDATGTSNLSGTNGKVLLANVITAQTGANPTGTQIIDKVGFGTANGNETASMVALSNTTSGSRLNGGCTDSDNNSSDFIAGAPNPRNSVTPFAVCSSNPALVITSPTTGATFSPTTTTVNVSLNVSNFVVANGSGDGHIHYTINTVAGPMKYDTTPIAIPTTPGSYTVYVELVDNAHAPIVPAVNATVTFTVASYNVVADLAALRADVVANGVGKYYQISSNPVVTFARTTRNQKYIQDASAAIVIDDVVGTLLVGVNGDALSGLKGQALDFNGLLEFTPTENATVASSGNTTTPQVVTIADVLANMETYESKLIKIQGVTFDATNTTFVANTNVPITAPTATTFRPIFTATEVDYIGQNIPTVTSDVVCFAGQSSVATVPTTNQVYFVARSLADITLGTPSFNAIDNLKIFVNNNNLFVTTNTTDDKQVNVYNLQGREVVSTITTGAGINVSDLASGIYIVKVTENGISETRKIAIK